MSDLKETLVKNFKKNIINLNGSEYVSIDVFQSAVSEVAVLESLLGATALKLNRDIEISEDEAIDYMTYSNEKVEISFKDGVYKISLNK